MDKRIIIREYRAALKLMDVHTWAGFLDKEWWTRDHYKGDPVYGNGKYYGDQEYDSDWGICNVCGSKQHGQYIGSHFRQSLTKLQEHQKAVGLYDELLKAIFTSILRKHGYKLKEEPEECIYTPLWETARKNIGSAIWGWDKVIEPIKKEVLQKINAV